MFINTTTSALPFVTPPTAREARSTEVAEILSQHKARRTELGALDLANYRSYAGGMAADIESTFSLGEEMDKMMEKMQRETAEANRRQAMQRNNGGDIQGNPYAGVSENSTSVTVDPWKKGENDCLERILRNQGYSLQEIYAKDKDGKTMIDRVVEVNGLKSPKHIQPGQTLQVPTRRPQSPGNEEFGRQEAQSDVGPARRETPPIPAVGGSPTPVSPPGPQEPEPADPVQRAPQNSEEVTPAKQTKQLGAVGFKPEVRAQHVYQALTNRDFDSLPSLLMDLSNQQMGELKGVYFEVSGKRWKRLEDHIEAALAGNDESSRLRRHTLLSIVAGNRHENGEMAEDKNAVHTAAEGIRSAFNQRNIEHIVTFLTSCSDEFIAKTNDELYNITAGELTLWVVVDRLLVNRESERSGSPKGAKRAEGYKELDPLVLKCLLARLPKDKGYKEAV